MSCSAIPKINRYLQRLVNVVSGLKLDGCCKTSRRLYLCSLLRLAFIAVFISSATIEPPVSFDILSLHWSSNYPSSYGDVNQQFVQQSGTVRVVGWICPRALITLLVQLYLSAHRILDSLQGAQLLKLELSNSASWEHFDLFSYLLLMPSIYPTQLPL